MYLGIDLGTSGVKVVLMDEQFGVQDSQSISLTCDHPHPLWSEQAPAQWWQATEQALDQLAKRTSLQAVKAIGVTGQMHGAVLVDSDGQPLRPAILWNDGRCAPQCERLNQRAPSIERITGNQLMTGMTAPKLLWVAEYEPDIFSQIAQVLLPKDYLRWKLSGCYATDMSDASGTLWLNVATRQWDETLLEACGLTLQQVPPLLEGPEVSGHLLEEHQQRWGFLQLCLSWQAEEIMRQGHWVWEYGSQAKRCSHWEPQAFILQSATVSMPIVAKPFIAFAMRYLKPGILCR